MAQMHIYYMSYIETFWPDVDITTFRYTQFPFVDKEPPWSFGFDSQTRGTRENRRTLC